MSIAQWLHVTDRLMAASIHAIVAAESDAAHVRLSQLLLHLPTCPVREPALTSTGWELYLLCTRIHTMGLFSIDVVRSMSEQLYRAMCRLYPQLQGPLLRSSLCMAWSRVTEQAFHSTMEALLRNDRTAMRLAIRRVLAFLPTCPERPALTTTCSVMYMMLVDLEGELMMGLAYGEQADKAGQKEKADKADQEEKANGAALASLGYVANMNAALCQTYPTLHATLMSEL